MYVIFFIDIWHMYLNDSNEDFPMPTEIHGLHAYTQLVLSKGLQWKEPTEFDAFFVSHLGTCCATAKLAKRAVPCAKLREEGNIDTSDRSFEFVWQVVFDVFVPGGTWPERGVLQGACARKQMGAPPALLSTFFRDIICIMSTSCLHYNYRIVLDI